MHKYWAIVFALLLGHSPAWALKVQAQGDITWVSGGIGKTERQQLAELSADFNVQLVFSASDSTYRADIPVWIRNAEHGLLLEVLSEGPKMFVRLPAGKYHITIDDHVAGQTKVITAPASGQKRYVFVTTVDMGL